MRHASSGIRPEFTASRGNAVGINFALSTRFALSESSPRRPCLAKKKWGRHCCRPHSYRRVVFPEEELDARRFPASRGQAPQSQLCRPALAPASVPSCIGKSVPKNIIAATWRNRDRTFVGGFPLPQSRNRNLAFASTSSRKIRPLRLRSHPGPSVTFRVHPKTFAVACFPDRAAFTAASKVVPKFLFPFRLLGLHFRRTNPRSRCVEAAPLERVAQGCKGGLIHQMHFSLWISGENSPSLCCGCERTRLAGQILRSREISGRVSPADAAEAH